MKELTSITKILPKYHSQTNLFPEWIDDIDVLTFAAEVAELFQVDKTCDPMVSFMRVSTYNALIPKRFRKIIECAYKEPITANGPVMYYDEVVSWTAKNFANCDVKITVECPKCHEHQCSCGDDSVLIRVDDEWLLANSERHYWENPRYAGVYGLNKPGAISSFYHPQFSLMRPAQSKYAGTNYHVRGCINLDRRLGSHAPITYQMVSKEAARYMRVNVEEGIVLMAYLANQYDDAGWPLVPNDTDVFDAIYWSVEAKMLWKNIRRSKDNYALLKEAKSEAKNYLDVAINKITAMTPQEWDALMRNHLKMVPYKNIDQQAGRELIDPYRPFLNSR